MVLLAVDPARPEPLYRQVIDALSRMIDSGALETGARLPPTRVLADRLGVNRSTVLRAYQELWALGYLESRPGSYSTVRRRVKEVQVPVGEAAGAIDWERVTSEGAKELYQQLGRFRSATHRAAEEVVDFSGLAADRALAPLGDLMRAIDRALREGGATVVDYGPPQGHTVLREVLTERMRTHGVAVTPEEVMITGGAQHGLDLVTRLLGRAGSSIVVEAPTYAAAIPLFRSHGVRLLPVPMGAEGMDLDALESVLDRERPAFVYTMPTFQNPTGITTSPAHRERLLGLCTGARVPLVEDGFEEELKYFGRAVLPIKALDHSGVVIYLGTFSKVLFPGLRIGWVAAARGCIERLAAVARFCNLSTSTLAQAAMARFCREGNLESYLRRVHGAYRRRMGLLLRLLRERLPRGVDWTEPAGGYTLLVRVPGATTDEDGVMRVLQEHGLHVAPGALFEPVAGSAPSFRLSIANLDEARIDEGVSRLSRALAAVLP